MKKNLFFFHLFCFFVIFSGMTVLAFYQMFVDLQYHRISPLTFLKPDVLRSALQKVPAAKVDARTDAIFFNQNGEVKDYSHQTLPTGGGIEPEHIFLIDEKKYGTKLVDNQLTIIDFDTQQTKQVNLPPAERYEVLGWVDVQHVLLSKKNQNFTVLKIDIDNASTQELITDITYSGESLFIAKSGKMHQLLYPDCFKKCSFVLYDLANDVEQKRIPAFTDASLTPGLSNLKLLFFDESRGFLAYETMESRELYLIDTHLNYLQYVRQENDRDVAEFVDYFPQTQQLIFSLKERDGSGQTVAAVAANDPSLHVLTKTSSLAPIITSQRALTYQIGNTVYDLNGEIVKQNVEGQLIEVYE